MSTITFWLGSEGEEAGRKKGEIPEERKQGFSSRKNLSYKVMKVKVSIKT